MRSRHDHVVAHLPCDETEPWPLIGIAPAIDPEYPDDTTSRQRPDGRVQMRERGHRMRVIDHEATADGSVLHPLKAPG